MMLSGVVYSLTECVNEFNYSIHQQNSSGSVDSYSVLFSEIIPIIPSQSMSKIVFIYDMSFYRSAVIQQ